MKTQLVFVPLLPSRLKYLRKPNKIKAWTEVIVWVIAKKCSMNRVQAKKSCKITICKLLIFKTAQSFWQITSKRHICSNQLTVEVFYRRPSQPAQWNINIFHHRKIPLPQLTRPSRGLHLRGADYQLSASHPWELCSTASRHIKEMESNPKMHQTH